MVSERYFLFGIEEMGTALSTIMPTSIQDNLLNNIFNSIKMGKIPKDKFLELMSNIINTNILKVLIDDPEIGDHIKNVAEGVYFIIHGDSSIDHPIDKKRLAG